MSKDITIRVIVEGNGNGTSSPLVCIEDEGEMLRLKYQNEHFKHLIDGKDEMINDMQATITRIKPENVTLIEQNKRLQRELVNQKQSYDSMDKAWRGSLAEHNKTSYARIERLETEIEALSKEISRLRAKLGMKAGEM